MSYSEFMFFFGISLNYSAVFLKMLANLHKISDKNSQTFFRQGILFRRLIAKDSSKLKREKNLKIA